MPSPRKRQPERTPAGLADMTPQLPPVDRNEAGRSSERHEPQLARARRGTPRVAGLDLHCHLDQCDEADGGSHRSRAACSTARAEPETRSPQAIAIIAGARYGWLSWACADQVPLLFTSQGSEF